MELENSLAKEKTELQRLETERSDLVAKVNFKKPLASKFRDDKFDF